MEKIEQVRLAQKIARRVLHLSVAALILTILFSVYPASAATDPPTPCLSPAGFVGADLAFLTGPSPHQAFLPNANSGVVRHYSSIGTTVGPRTGGVQPCTTWTNFADILPPLGVGSAWGATLDGSNNLFVSAGPGVFSINQILRIPPSYTTPATFFTGGTNFRSLATDPIAGNVLYAADFAAGVILRFNLAICPTVATTSCESTFAAVPGVFGIFANGLDDLFVTSNCGFTGIASGVGSCSVLHVSASSCTLSSGILTSCATTASGLGFPEGIAGSGPAVFSFFICPATCLYIAAGGVVFEFTLPSGPLTFFAGSPISASHGVAFWTGGVYVTDSLVGNVFKVS